MKLKKFLVFFLLAFVLTFFVNAIMMYLLNLIWQGRGTFDWVVTISLAITCGIVLPLFYCIAEKKSQSCDVVEQEGNIEGS